MEFTYSKGKDELLKLQRSICFDDIIKVLKSGRGVTFSKHSDPLKYSNQIIYEVLINDYIYCVPAVPNENGAFLKTIYQSRKATRNLKRMKE